MFEESSRDTALVRDVPSRAVTARTRAQGAIAVLWRLRWLALATLAFLASRSTALGVDPERLLPVVATALELKALDDADTERSERSHGLRDIGTPADVELDAVELDEEDDRHPATCVGGNASPATRLLAASRGAGRARGAETAAKPSRAVFGAGSPRGPPV